MESHILFVLFDFKEIFDLMCLVLKHNELLFVIVDLNAKRMNCITMYNILYLSKLLCVPLCSFVFGLCGFTVFVTAFSLMLFVSLFFFFDHFSGGESRRRWFC